MHNQQLSMETKSITKLKDVHVSNTDFTIKVRVVRRWTKMDYKNPNDFYSIELVIQDEDNTRMLCSVSKKFGRQYDKLLDENIPLFISRPSLAFIPGKYKLIPNDQKVVFTHNTKVTVAEDFSGNAFGFAFANFQDILSKKITEDELIDVIGVVSQVFPKKFIDLKNGKQSPKIRVHIRDLEDHTIEAALWESYCDRFEEFIQKHPNKKNVVIILQFCKVNWWQDDSPSVQNAFDKSRFWIDEDLDDINNFKSSLLQHSVHQGSTSQSIGDSIVSSSTSVEDEFLRNAYFSFISDLHDLTEPKSVIILGTIKGIDKNNEWYFDSCSKCFKKVTVSDDRKEVICSTEKCKSYQISAVTRYKICIRVQDMTGTVTITMFDTHANKLIGIRASDLLKNKDEFDADETIPKCFNILLEKRFAFKILVQQYNLEKNVGNYRISKLSDDPYIISALEKKFHAHEYALDETVNLGFDDVPLNNLVTIKDTVSSTGENITPISDVVKSDGKKKIVGPVSPSHIDQETCLKRNLTDVYEVDDSPTPTSTKTRLSNNINEDQKLLIPKLEK